MSWNRVIRELKAFFASGIFYILLGGFFLYQAYAISQENRAHTAFVFLLAVLGVAIVLYGTGTNAVGEGSTGNIKVAIAGGAGVLALLLGFGVIQYADGLASVFKRTLDYGVLELRVDKNSSAGSTTDLTLFDVRAQIAGSRPLHLWNNNQVIQIVVPIVDAGIPTDVEIFIVPKAGTRELYDNFHRIIPVDWSGEEAKQAYGFNNEIVSEISKPLDLASTSIAVANLPDDGKPAEVRQLSAE